MLSDAGDPTPLTPKTPRKLIIEDDSSGDDDEDDFKEKGQQNTPPMFKRDTFTEPQAKEIVSAAKGETEADPERKVEVPKSNDYFELSDLSGDEMGVGEEETVVGALLNDSAKKTPRTPRSGSSGGKTPSFKEKIAAEIIKTTSEIEDLKRQLEEKQ